MCEPRGSKANSRCRAGQQTAEETPSHKLRHLPQSWRACLSAVAVVLTATFAFAQSPACPPNSAEYPCVYVANNGGDSVSVVNANTNRVIGTIAVGSLPAGIAVSPDNKFAYVANSGDNTVSMIETATGIVKTTFQKLTGQGASQIAVTPDGRYVYVSGPGTDFSTMDRIDTTNAVVDSVAGTTYPTAITFAPGGTIAYVSDACGSLACVDIVDTTSSPPKVILKPIPIPGTFFAAFVPVGASSIAITADGSLVCISATDANRQLEVGCVTTSNSGVSVVGLKVTSDLTDYGMGIAPNGMLYVVEPGISDVSQTTVGLVTISPLKAQNPIQVGRGPSGVAVGPGGGSVYVTNSTDSTVSIIDTTSNSATTISGSFAAPQGVAAMTAALPIISMQPSSQTIQSGTSATLTVVASSAAPATFQWYQGQSGDTSIPIEGAVGSTYVTPVLTTTTNYWVQVTNIAGPVNSNTATITVTTNHPPNCTLVVVGAGSPTFTNPLGVIATATCPDPQGAAVTATIDFGDGSPLATGPTVNNVFTATHTYAGVNTYPIHVTATNSFGLQSSPAFYSWTLVPTTQAPPVFSGQTSTVTVTLSSPSGQPETVTFECTTVTTVNGTTVTFTPATAVGISCNSVPDPITLTSVPQTVTLEIHTTGPAVAQARHTDRQIWAGALLFPLPVFALVGIGCWPGRSRRRKAACITAAALVLLALSVSCGGGFKAPTVQLITPPGNYQVTVIDLPSGTQSGFVQTSLIVPLTVSPFQ